MILIKLGGSVITDKTQYAKFNDTVVERLCKEIAESGKGVMIVHGAGSFGHVLSKQYRLQDGLLDYGQVAAVAKVQNDVRRLSNMVTDKLINVGIPATPVPPGSCFVMDNGKLIVTDEEPMMRLIGLGIMPVTFGDVVTDRKKGFGICSGDKLMEYMCERFRPTKVIFVSDIDGLYDRDPKSDPDAKMIPEVTSSTLENVDGRGKTDDVTGGVRAKMEAMLRMTTPDRECILVNGNVPGRLLSVLKGEDVPCTKAKGGLQ